jgi:hypothetical protein
MRSSGSRSKENQASGDSRHRMRSGPLAFSQT